MDREQKSCRHARACQPEFLEQKCQSGNGEYTEEKRRQAQSDFRKGRSIFRAEHLPRVDRQSRENAVQDVVVRFAVIEERPAPAEFAEAHAAVIARPVIPLHGLLKGFPFVIPKVVTQTRGAHARSQKHCRGHQRPEPAGCSVGRYCFRIVAAQPPPAREVKSGYPDQREQPAPPPVDRGKILEWDVVHLRRRSAPRLRGEH